jgi:MFS family permease
VKNSATQVRYMLAIVVDSIGSGMYLPLSLLYFHHVTGLPLAQVGVIMSGAALLSLVSNPIAGVLVDRYGARRVVIGGYLVRASGFFLYPLVDSPVPMFLAVALVALGDGSFPPSMQSFVAELVQGSARDKLLGAQRSLRNAGLGAGGLVAGAALGLGSDSAYYVIVVASGIAFVGAAALVRTIPAARTSAETAARVPVRGGYRLVLHNRPFLTLTLVNVPTAFGYMVLAVSLPVYLTQELGASNSLVGVLYAVNTVGIALLQIPVTRLLIRYRRTRAVALGGGVFSVSFLAFAALGLFAGGSILLVGVFVATALFTLGELLHGATASALVASAAPEATRGRHLSVYQLSWAVPTALAPAVLTGLLTLSPIGMWLVLATGVACSAFAMLRLEARLPAEAVRSRLPVAETAPVPAVPGGS